MYLDAGSPQHPYQYMQKYILIGLMNIYWINPSENLIHDIISIIFLRKICMVSIKEKIIPNPLFKSSGTLLVILSVSRNVDFDDDREFF